jgi:DNA-binding MarR family transcriptional regulator
MNDFEDHPTGGNEIGAMAHDCLLMRTRLVSRVVTSIYDEALRPFGIVSPQFALLLVIAKIGPASRAEIGRFHRQDRSTLTRNVKPMLSAGWIEEVQDGERGRARRIAVTNAGRRLLQEAAPAWRSAQRRTRAKLGDGMDVVADTANGLMKEHPTA